MIKGVSDFTDVKFSGAAGEPNGLLAVASTNGVIVVLSRNPDWRVDYIREHTLAVNRLAFHPTDLRLVSASQDGTLRLWDVSSRPSVRALLDGKSHAARDVQFNPRSSTEFAAVFESGFLQTWDSVRGEQTRRLSAHSGPALCLDWHSSGYVVATGGMDKAIYLWDIREPRRYAAHLHAPSGVYRVAFRPLSDTQLASCAITSSTKSADPTVHVWDFRRPYVPIVSWKPHTGMVSGVVWCSGLGRIATCSKDKTVAMYGIKEGRAVVEELSTSAIAMSCSEEMTLAVGPTQSDYAKDDSSVPIAPSHSLCGGVQVSSRASFNYLAENYSWGKKRGTTLVHCEINAAVAETVGQYSVAQTWRMLHLLSLQPGGALRTPHEFEPDELVLVHDVLEFYAELGNVQMCVMVLLVLGMEHEMEEVWIGSYVVWPSSRNNVSRMRQIHVGDDSRVSLVLAVPESMHGGGAFPPQLHFPLGAFAESPDTATIMRTSLMLALFLVLLPLLATAAPLASSCDRAVGCLTLSALSDSAPVLPVGHNRKGALLPLRIDVESDVPKNLVVEAFTADGSTFLGKSHVHGVASTDGPVSVALNLPRACEDLIQFLDGITTEVTVIIRAWLTPENPNFAQAPANKVSKTVVLFRPNKPAVQQVAIIENAAAPALQLKKIAPLVKRQRSCDTIHAAYAAGTAMTAQDYSDWAAWSCNTWYPGGIGSSSGGGGTTRTCDTIYAAKQAGVTMTAQDFSDWAAWGCNQSSGPCSSPTAGCVDATSFPATISATAGGGSGYVLTLRAWASVQKDLFVEFRKDGVIVSNYAYASLPAASTSAWTSISVTLTYPTQTAGGTYQFFVWLTSPGTSWGGQTFNTLLPVTLSGGTTPPPPPPPPPSGGGRGSAAGAYISTCKTAGQYALTFDDGPHIYTSGLKSILAQYGIKATFFVNGQNWGSIYNYGDLLRDSVAQGHQIAMHGWSHCDFTVPSTCIYANEVDQLMNAINSIIGKTPSYFRFPYGSYDGAAQNYVAGKGLRIVGWNLDTNDWQDANKADPSLTLGTIQGALNSVSSSYATWVALEHDVWPTTAGATSNSWIWAGLSFIQSKGYRFVTIAECDGDSTGGYL
ncbi:WD repeat-containing protein 24 [Gonapodya sp. JEL0774]|nr:WD repeat-containing protein 24 [Gonapodya sp. JEL0774]